MNILYDKIKLLS